MINKVKFHIISKNQIALDQDAKAGDIVDLTDEQNLDSSIISENIEKIVETNTKKAQQDWQAQQDVILKNEVAAQVLKKENELKEAFNKKELEYNNDKKELEAKLNEINNSLQTTIENEKLKLNEENQNKLRQKDEELTNVKNELARKKELEKSEFERLSSELELKSRQDLQERDLKINNLEQEVKNATDKNELALKNEKEKYEIQISSLNDQLAQAKDFKAKQSTKEIGESLEIYAKNQFDKIRMAAYPNAYFEKDNEVDARGSKADFIFRDYIDGFEYISIIFDMKTEMETTKTKHKNSDFFNELDRDRKSKKTEYAVLVSTLEADNDYYNDGIVQVYEKEKMFVVRPQLMLQLIGLLCSAAKNSVKYQKQISEMRNENIDITKFQDSLNDFKGKFGKNYASAAQHFEKAIKEIDNSIKKMNAIKSELTTSQRQLRLANDKLEYINIERLSKDSPSINKQIKELNNK